MSTQLIAIKQGKKQAQGKISDSYRTPPWLFKWLDNEYDFEFDICASNENALCEKFYTEENSALRVDWSNYGSVGFCNPPFSSGSKEKFMAAAYENMVNNEVSSVFLIPSDVSNCFWGSHILGKATKITVIIGRVKFYDPVTAQEAKSGLGCAVVEFMHGEQSVSKIENFVIRDNIKKKYE